MGAISQHEAEQILEEAALPGLVLLFGTPMTKAERWTEGDVHVVRSTEFDLVVGAATLQEACQRLVEALEDYAEYVDDVPEDEVTINELEQAATIFRRLARALRRRAEREQTRKRALEILVGRRRRLNRGIGFQSTPARSGQRSTV